MTNRKHIVILILCLTVIVAIVMVWDKPSISQYEDSFGFSLGNTKVRVIDYYHHPDFRDSISIYRVSVTENTDGNIFDDNLMIAGLSSEAEIMLDMAIEVSGNNNFDDLILINKGNCRSTVLKEKKDGDAELCIIDYGIDSQYLVIWVG